MKKVVGKKVLILLSLLLFLPLFSGCFLAPMNHAPVITSTPITIALVDELYTYDVKATDSDNDILTYSLTTNPIGMTIDSVTGEISWTPISSQIGDNDVSVEVSDGEEIATQSFIITVYDILISITVLPETMTLFVGEEHTINSITASHNYGPDKILTLADCSYSWDLGGIASDLDGVVTGEVAGSDVVTVSYEENSITKSDSVEVTVVPKLDHIVVLPVTMTLFEGGSTQSINSITAHYNDTSTANIALSDCTHSSSNESVATVAAGMITSVSPGTATISVSYTEEGITKFDTVVVTVNAIELTSITVLPETMSLFVGEDHTITSIIAHYNYGPDKILTLVDCSYSWNYRGIASITDGEVTGVAEGSDTLTVNYTEGTITKTDTVAVTVNPIPPNLELLPHTQNAKIGESFSINVEVENVTDLLGASITLNFDHVAMPFLSATPGSFFSAADVLADLSGPLGSITLNLGSVEPASGTGTIMIVSFIAVIKGNNYPITFGVTELKDKDNQIIVHTTGSGCKVHIKK